ncbi:ankyrin repeat domain-containing protein [Candidatus Methylacidithermus pantelleriae]|uniref:L,D-TPase catalytic domain-containing protein n=1 Tax=Candidatus Methylacidithermus pantelleriae TaxID=2744239 RepID=A0A8J2FSP9_9BACT|nr:ankyrin repeat domain-containing protein [Candidatus Methylacidithermus pantelleriae]CAF0700880.1 hypothetical protein MPNT_40064 [Candidatus Methylacidithermus pantelleriae]
MYSARPGLCHSDSLARRTVLRSVLETRTSDNVKRRIRIVPCVLAGLLLFEGCQKTPSRLGSSGEPNRATPVRSSEAAGKKSTAPIGPSQLVEAASQGDLPLLEQAVRAGISLDQPDPHGVVALVAAVSQRRADIVRFLLGAGANPRIPLSGGGSLVHLAVARGDPEIARILLQAGAPLESLDGEGRTPLALAVELDDPAMVRELVQAGANPNQEEPKYGQPLVMSAILEEKDAVLEALLENGADPNVSLANHTLGLEQWLKSFPDPKEHVSWYLHHERSITALMLATLVGRESSAEILLRFGADPDRVTRPHGMTALDFAAEAHRNTLLQILLGKSPRPEDQRYWIWVSLGSQRARLYDSENLLLEAPISTGRRGYETPKGEYVVTQKYKSWVSTLYRAPMPHFLRLNCGPMGLHGGPLPGYPASHGCIRLPYDKAQAFYRIAQRGTLVYVTD